MNHMLRKVIIVLSVILLFFVATMIYVLYGIYDTNSIKLDSNHKELVTLSKNDNQNVVLDEVGVKNDFKKEDLLIDEITTDDIESDTETTDAKILTPEEKYKAKDDFVKIDTREKKDTFCFVGDIFLSRRPRAAYDEKGIDGIIDSGFKKILDGSDFNIGNLECSITDDEENVADKTFTFALPTKYVKALTETGINLLTLANNHILDYGTDAMLNTIKELDNNEISHIGAGKNIEEARTCFIKEIDGKRYALIAASAVLPSDSWKAGDDRAGIFDGYNLKELCNELRNVRPFVDKVIVYMHWGRELDTVSNDWQKNIGRRLIDVGADLVIGTHPHVTQEIEYYKNVPIVYSLGNFIYGGTMRDMMLVEAVFDYSIDKNGQLQLIVVPGVTSYEQVKRYWKKETIKEKIQELQDKSSTCYIGDNGYVFTMEQVEAALNTLASSEKIN